MHRALPHIVLAAVVGVAAGCGNGGGGTTSGERPRDGRAQIVAQHGCLACHTLNGEGNDNSGFDLTRVGAQRTRAQIRRSLADPPPPMPSYESLSDTEREQLIDALAGLR